MSKPTKEEEVTPEVAQKVTEYVYKNYKSFVDKPLTIKDKGSHFQILKHKDEGPLFLGKTIL